MNGITPLRAARLKRALTLNEVSAKTGIKIPNLSLMERGLMGITPHNAELLVKCLGRALITEEMVLYPERFSKREKATA